jgi:hypothetical protein
MPVTSAVGGANAVLARPHPRCSFNLRFLAGDPILNVSLDEVYRALGSSGAFPVDGDRNSSWNGFTVDDIIAGLQEICVLHRKESPPAEAHEFFTRKNGHPLRQSLIHTLSCNYTSSLTVDGEICLEVCVVLRLRAGKGGFGKQLAKRGRMFHTLRSRTGRTQRADNRPEVSVGEGGMTAATSKALDAINKFFRFQRTKRAAEEVLLEKGKDASGADQQQRRRRTGSRAGPKQIEEDIILRSHVDPMTNLEADRTEKLRVAQERDRVFEVLSTCLRIGIETKVQSLSTSADANLE